MFNRIQTFIDIGDESCFLWGPRQTGKSTLVKEHFSDAVMYDLLLSEVYEKLTRRPSIVREELSVRKTKHPVIIDEVQLIPQLLNEVQWLIVNKRVQFILCGSSARKIMRSTGNLLGGRALRFQLFPLVSKEIPNFDLEKALTSGLLPRHYLAEKTGNLLQAYVGTYLKEEIAAEGLARNIPAFSRFLESAAFSNGEIVNYVNIASECGVDARTVKEYFQILTDTHVGLFLESYRKKPKRRVIQAPKFYYFDVGIANYLLKRHIVVPGNEVFGKAFEHFILQELTAHAHYSGLSYPVRYWRTASQLEVDFIIGDHETAVEVKSSTEITERHLTGMNAFCEEYKPRRAIVVSLDAHPRKIGNITILPWKVFLDMLWAGDIVG